MGNQNNLTQQFDTGSLFIKIHLIPSFVAYCKNPNKKSLPEYGYFGLKYSTPEKFKKKNLFYCGYEKKINLIGKFETKIENIKINIKQGNNNINNNEENENDFNFSTFNCQEGMNGSPLLIKEDNDDKLVKFRHFERFNEVIVFDKVDKFEIFLQ